MIELALVAVDGDEWFMVEKREQVLSPGIRIGEKKEGQEIRAQEGVN
jgi:hypothetical protein